MSGGSSSISPGRNAASLVTSAIRSSEGAKFGESAFSSIYERSAPLLVLTSAPSRSSASAICCEDFDAVPSSSRSIAIDARPRASGLSDADPASNASATCVTGTAVR